MKRTVVIIVVALVIIIAVLTTARFKRGAVKTRAIGPAMTMITNAAPTNAAYPGRSPARLGDVITDAQDPEFVERVLPGLRRFFATLDRAGVNPLKDKPLAFDKIKISYPPNGLSCQFVMNDSWTAIYDDTPKYSGIMYFGQRGPDNPNRAISHANTNALIRLSQRAIKMPQVEAERIINEITEAFSVNRSQFEKPQIIPVRMFEYDLGMYSVRFRKRGTDPLNGMNYTLRFSIKATSPTNAVLVEYGDISSSR